MAEFSIRLNTTAWVFYRERNNGCVTFRKTEGDRTTFYTIDSNPRNKDTIREMVPDASNRGKTKINRELASQDVPGNINEAERTSLDALTCLRAQLLAGHRAEDIMNLDPVITDAHLAAVDAQPMAPSSLDLPSLPVNQ